MRNPSGIIVALVAALSLGACGGSSGDPCAKIQKADCSKSDDPEACAAIKEQVKGQDKDSCQAFLEMNTMKSALK